METLTRFSQIYLERGEPVKDSERFRRRLCGYYIRNLHHAMNEALSRYAEERLGIVIGYTPKHTELFFIRADIRDILDIVTFIYAFSLHLERQHFSTTRFAQLWHDHVSLALKEENMGYRLDDSGVVHYHIDEEFERNRVSTIAALGDVRYTSVLEAYNSAYRHMDHPMDTKAAVRSMFEALEILAKKMVDTSNLNKWLLENDRSPLRAKFFSLHGTSTNQKVVSGMLEQLR